jgi:predicted patatin/cPLA2 family phospholipase
MERLQSFEQSTEKSASLINNLKRKKDLLDRDDPAHEQIRTALIIEGGGMRGVYAGGIVTGLEEAGMRNVFDLVVGISSGSAASAYFLSGQAEMGTSIYYEDLANRQFINPRRVWKMLDVTYVDAVFRQAKPLDTDAVKQSRSNFLISVTDPATARCQMIDAKDPGVDIVTAIQASSALPVAYNRTVAVGEQEYVDGVIGCGLPLEYTLDQGYDNILVVLNRVFEAKGEQTPNIEKIIAHLAMRGRFSQELRTAYLTRNQLYNAGINRVNERISGDTNIAVGIVSPDTMPLSRLETNRELMKQVAAGAKEQVRSIFK